MSKYNIGYSELTKNVYVGRLNKKGNAWLEKECVSDEFDVIAIQRYIKEPFVVELENGKKYIIQAKEIN